MSKERYPFCPDSCGNMPEQNPKICTPPDPIDHCYYSNDREIPPFSVDVIRYGDVYRKGRVVGRNGKDWIFDNGSRIQKGSSLIKK